MRKGYDCKFTISSKVKSNSKLSHQIEDQNMKNIITSVKHMTLNAFFQIRGLRNAEQIKNIFFLTLRLFNLSINEAPSPLLSPET